MLFYRPDNLFLLLRSILSMKISERLQPTLKEAAQLSFRRLEELSPAHMCLLISRAGNLGFAVPYKKLQVRLLRDHPRISSPRLLYRVARTDQYLLGIIVAEAKFF